MDYSPCVKPDHADWDDQPKAKRFQRFHGDLLDGASGRDDGRFPDRSGCDSAPPSAQGWSADRSRRCRQNALKVIVVSVRTMSGMSNRFSDRKWPTSLSSGT